MNLHFATPLDCSCICISLFRLTTSSFVQAISASFVSVNLSQFSSCLTALSAASLLLPLLTLFILLLLPLFLYPFLNSFLLSYFPFSLSRISLFLSSFSFFSSTFVSEQTEGYARSGSNYSEVSQSPTCISHLASQCEASWPARASWDCRL